MENHAKKCAYGRTNAVIDCDCDGYHTFTELYDHRITIYIALCKAAWGMDLVSKNAHNIGMKNPVFFPVWRSQWHSDGSSMDGWFVLGIGKEKGEQITYHLPNSRWDEVSFAETLEKAPEFDGHTSDDVLKRLANLKI